MRWLLPILMAAASVAGADGARPIRPDVLLVTLDTTRADAIGTSTPVVTALAALGTRFQVAVTPAPLTLPAHSTLLTGLDPSEHGVRSNGGETLAATHPTLATILAEAGWSTGAVVGSRILDHRFGLGRGFDSYDDNMPAEQIGEYGYPERDARAVTDAAIAWLKEAGRERSFFLWVHYYDPHAPYNPPGGPVGSGDLDAYLGEVAFVDRQLGRLLRALPGGLRGTIVVIVGDHGEALGDHGERTHGLFLYRATIEVPLVLAGPLVPRARVVDEPVGLCQLAPTVLRLAGLPDNSVARRPGLPIADGENASVGPIYAEATLPRTAYGWASLRAVMSGGLKLIDAPRRELYDLTSDPAELHNLADARPDDVDRLSALLEQEFAAEERLVGAPPPVLDAETRAALRSLGYVGEEAASSDGIDPKEGVGILHELDEATDQLRRGDVEPAVERLEELVRRNPANGPLQTRYGEALLAAGHGDRAIAAYRAAVSLRPRSEFALRNLGEALLTLGRNGDAKRAFEEAVAIDPRMMPVWLRLAELAPAGERADILHRALANGVVSATIWLELAELEFATDPAAALESCRAASTLAPTSADAALCLGRAHLAAGEPGRAAPNLRRAAVIGRGTPVAAEAEQLLGELSPRREGAQGEDGR